MKTISGITGVLVLALLSLTGYPSTTKNTNNTLNFHTSKKTEPDSSILNPSAIYGVFTIKPDLNTRLTAVNNLGVEYVRETQLLSRWNGTKNYNIDFWKTYSKKILLNINNDSTPSPFPTDLVAYESKLRSFLNVYAGSVELAVIENEELNSPLYQNTLYHLGSMQDYINELTVAASVCREMGVPITNGGLTYPIISSLRHYYEINGKQDSLNWLVQQMSGISPDSSLWLTTDSLLNAFKDIPLSYINLHWYEPVKDTTRLTGVLQVVCNYITQQTGKKVITNETGVKTTDSSFVTQLLQEWNDTDADYCVFFDGAGEYNAQPLTSSTGDLLANGVAFRDFAAGKKSCDQSITVTPGGPVITCYNDNVTLAASAGFSNYFWNTGDTSQSISVNATGNYSVVSNMGNCTAFSNSVVVKVNPLPAQPVIATNPSPSIEVCPSKTVVLMSSAALSYLWNTGDTTKTITVNEPGSYFVTVSDMNGCRNTSDPVTVSFQKGDAPTNLRVTDITPYRVTLNWDTTACAVGYQFQYREKGTKIWTAAQVLQGSTTSRFIYGLTPSVTYEWKILTCSQTTPDTITSAFAFGPEFTTLAAAGEARSANAAVSNFNEMIYPVPAKDIATVSLRHVSSDLKIILTDLSGKILWHSEKITNTSVGIPVAHLSKGMYIVIIKDKEHSEVLKLIKE